MAVEKPIFLLLYLEKLIPIVIQCLELDDANNGRDDKKKGYQQGDDNLKSKLRWSLLFSHQAGGSRMKRNASGLVSGMS